MIKRLSILASIIVFSSTFASGKPLFSGIKALKIRNLMQQNVIAKESAINKMIWVWEQFQNKYAAYNSRITLSGPPASGKSFMATEFAKALFPEKQPFYLDLHGRWFHQWQITGAPSGYIASDAVPPFVNWLNDPKGGKGGGVIILDIGSQPYSEFVRFLSRALAYGKITVEDSGRTAITRTGKGYGDREFNHMTLIVTTNPAEDHLSESVFAQFAPYGPILVGDRCTDLLNEM